MLAWYVASLAGVPAMARAQLAAVASDAGFKVARFQVNGVKRLNELKVYERALAQRDRAMPLVDIDGLRTELLQLSWVEDARVSRQLPDTLVIDIIERKPHAVLRKPDRLVLIDATGHELETVSAARAKGRLILSGPDAGQQVANLKALLEAAPAVRPQVSEADWVGHRRWNLTFRTGQVLALPEGPRLAADALVTFARLDGSNRLIGGKVAAFDMRSADRIYLRIPESSGEEKAPSRASPDRIPSLPPSQAQLQLGEALMPPARISRVFGAINLGSFRISAMVAGLSDTGEMIVLGSGHRASQGIRRGYVTDMAAATYAVRDAIDRAEKMANTSVPSVWVGCSGAGLASQTAQVEVDIGGRRIEQDDIDQLLFAGRDVIQPDGRMVLHAQPAHYTLDGANGVADPQGPARRAPGGRHPRHAGRRRAGAQHHRSGAERAPRRRSRGRFADRGGIRLPFARRARPWRRARRTGRGSDQCLGLCRGHAGRAGIDPGRIGRHHRRRSLRPSASAVTRPNGSSACTGRRSPVPPTTARWFRSMPPARKAPDRSRATPTTRTAFRAPN